MTFAKEQTWRLGRPIKAGTIVSSSILCCCNRVTETRAWTIRKRNTSGSSESWEAQDQVTAGQGPASLLPRGGLQGCARWRGGTLCPYMAQEQRRKKPHPQALVMAALLHSGGWNAHDLNSSKESQHCIWNSFPAHECRGHTMQNYLDIYVFGPRMLIQSLKQPCMCS